jgi:hypothetical protein
VNRPHSFHSSSDSPSACCSTQDSDTCACLAERATAWLGTDAWSSLRDAKSSLGDAKSSLGDAKSSLGDAKSSLGDAKSSLGDNRGETHATAD